MGKTVKRLIPWNSRACRKQTFSFLTKARKMKIFAIAVLVVIAGVSQIRAACTDSMPSDNSCSYSCDKARQQLRIPQLLSQYCGISMKGCSQKADGGSETFKIRDYCKESCQGRRTCAIEDCDGQGACPGGCRCEFFEGKLGCLPLGHDLGKMDPEDYDNCKI